MSGLFPTLPTQISAERQIECVTRELGYRRRVFQRRVNEGRMSRKQMDAEIAAMEAVLGTVTLAKTKA